LGLLLLAALLGWPSNLLAAVPDWLRDAARTELGKYPDDTNAVVLLDEQVTTVSDSGEIRTLYRRAYKILRPEGRKHGTVTVYFDNETSLNHLKAWSLPAGGGEYEVKDKEAIETGISEEALYADTRHKLLEIPAADPGNVIGYEYEQRRRPSILQDTWWFQDEIPVKRARFQLQLPAGWEYRAFWLNHDAIKPREAGQSQWEWEVKDVPPVEPEPSMPAFRAVAGRLGVAYYPREGNAGGNSPASWATIGRWDSQLNADRRQPTPEIRQKVAELTSQTSSPLEKIRVLAAFVQKEIRYVAIEIGIGGYQAHPAGDIFKNRYGDCKDKATLLSTMLAVAGVKSYYVSINSSRGVVAPDFPTALTFDHMILAIALPADLDLTPNKLWAVNDDPQHGRLLFFDPTDPLVPLGYLPNQLQDNYGLLITSESGELVKLPLLPPATNRLLRSATLNLTAEGTLYGTVNEVRWGSPAVELRAELQKLSEADRVKWLESFLEGFLAGSTLKGYGMQGLDMSDASLVVQYSFVASSYGKMAGNLLLLRLRVLGHKGEDLEDTKTNGERKYPVEFESATAQGDIVDITLPKGFKVDELPVPVQLSIGPASYKSKSQITDQGIHYVRLYQVDDVHLPLARVSELKQFYRQIGTDERSVAVLKPLAP
jgi:transglutaminase-like putative cysteine protease